jgi:hypothetical protein
MHVICRGNQHEPPVILPRAVFPATIIVRGIAAVLPFPVVELSPIVADAVHLAERATAAFRGRCEDCSRTHTIGAAGGGFPFASVIESHIRRRPGAAGGPVVPPAVLAIRPDLDRVAGTGPITFAIVMRVPAAGGHIVLHGTAERVNANLAVVAIQHSSPFRAPSSLRGMALYPLGQTSP